MKMIVNFYCDGCPNVLMLEIEKRDFRKLIKILNCYRRDFEDEYNTNDFVDTLKNLDFKFRRITIDKGVYF